MLLDDTDKNKGVGLHDDPEGYSEAGEEGGEATSEKYGEEFYSEIGRKGEESAQEEGATHELTEEERTRGGKKGGRK